MGKKATLYLLYNFLILITVVLFLLAAAGARASYVNPHQQDLYLFLGFILPLILLVNLIVLIYWAVRRKLWLLFPLGALLINWAFIGAMLQFPGDKPSQQQPDLKIGTYNIHRFEHKDNPVPMTTTQVADFFAQEGADVVCFQEFVPARKFNMDSIAAVFDYLPYSIYKGPGQAVFSKFPITDFQFFGFKDTDNSALRVDLDVNGQTVRLFNVHLQTTGMDPMKRTLVEGLKSGNLTGGGEIAVKMKDLYHKNACARAEQALQVSAAIEEASKQMPVIVCGDFNDTPASFTYRTMKGSLTDGFRDCGHGYANTFRYINTPIRLDYIFYNDKLSGQRYYIPAVDYSDHRPSLLEVNFKAD